MHCHRPKLPIYLEKTILALEKRPEEKTEEELQKLIVPLIRTVMDRLLQTENEGKGAELAEIELTPEDMRLLALQLKF